MERWEDIPALSLSLVHSLAALVLSLCAYVFVCLVCLNACMHTYMCPQVYVHMQMEARG